MTGLSNAFAPLHPYSSGEPLYRDESTIYLPKTDFGWSGLVYLKCGQAISNYNTVKAVDDVDSLYFKAIQATHNVPQERSVHIFWMGREIGTLRGQA